MNNDYFQNRNSRKNLKLNDFADVNKMDRHIIKSIVEHIADVGIIYTNYRYY